MYRKEEILSLLKDPNDSENDIDNDLNQKPTLKSHKVSNDTGLLVNLFCKHVSFE